MDQQEKSREVYRTLANKVRAHSIIMTNRAHSGHLGSMLSEADLLAVLYESILNVDPKDPKMPDRDRFILSKGHAGGGLYAVLAEKGFFPLDWLDGYYMDHGKLSGHVSHHVPGVEFSTGSLGHGLPVAVGMALAAKVKGQKHRVFCMVSDGDMDEGSTWEAIMFAGQHNLDNLVVVMDYNHVQALNASDRVINLEPLQDKMVQFRWACRRIDGHDYHQIYEALHALPVEQDKPSIIIADTVKCKGIPAMENTVKSHYWFVPDEDLEKTIAELEVYA